MIRSRLDSEEIVPHSISVFRVDVGGECEQGVEVKVIDIASNREDCMPSSFNGFLKIPGSKARYGVHGVLQEGLTVYHIEASFQCWSVLFKGCKT